MTDKVYKQTIIVHISFIYLQDGFLVSNNTAYMVEPAGKLANIFQNSSHYLRKRSAGIIASKFYYIFDMGAVVVLIVWQFDLQLPVQYHFKEMYRLILDFTVLELHIEHRIVEGVIVWQLHLQVHMQSVPITTNVVNSNLAHGEVYSIQNYVIKFVSDLRQVGGFLSVLRFPPPSTMTPTI